MTLLIGELEAGVAGWLAVGATGKATGDVTSCATGRATFDCLLAVVAWLGCCWLLSMPRAVAVCVLDFLGRDLVASFSFLA